MRYVATLALVSAVVACACSLLGPNSFGQDDRRPIEIPTSAVTPLDLEVVRGEMRLEGSCLYLQVRERDDVLPIWPAGFNALKGKMFLGLRNGPDDEKVFAVGAELLELHGQTVEVPPPDARVPVACATYPLFHVREAFNRS